MKILIAFPMAALLMAAADAPPAGSPAPPVPASAAAALPAGIPDGAVQVAPYTYRVVRPDGQRWIYRVTPFGLASAEEKAAPRDRKEKALTVVTAAQYGDLILFEWATPFGPVRWQKKESELNEMEQAVWQRDKSRGGSAQE